MDQQIGNELPPLHNPEQVPQNQFEVPQAPASTELQMARQIEQGISQGSSVSQTPQVPSLMPGGTVPADPTAQQGASAASMPQIADDTELIEKEWVLKAKEIVARTRHDPYQQNKEVEQMKADYLKKRYNKDIKITED